MNRVIVEQRVGGTGVLELTLPLGADEAGRDVRVTIEPVVRENKMTSDEWRSWVQSIAGSWQGDFERPSQGDLEEREPLS